MLNAMLAMVMVVLATPMVVPGIIEGIVLKMPGHAKLRISESNQPISLRLSSRVSEWFRV